MRASTPAFGEDDSNRGRKRTIKCLFQKSPTVNRRGTLVEEFNKDRQVFKKEWFAADLDTDGEQNTAQCECGFTLTLTNGNHIDSFHSKKMASYPPYLKIPCGDILLVKGSTSQLVMQLHEDDIPITRIPSQLAKRQPTERYSRVEVQSIIRTCTLLDLTGHTHSTTESWENELIEGWWFKEESFCEISRRERPVGREVTGFESDKGWWKHKQSAKDRDWSRWGYRSVGPESWRRSQYRLYDLYGSGALRTDGGD